jgi:hypothetical protein
MHLDKKGYDLVRFKFSSQNQTKGEQNGICNLAPKCGKFIRQHKNIGARF